jgi:solute carrier organic anion transporter family, member 4A
LRLFLIYKLLSGAVMVPAGGGGTFLGGYLVKKLSLSCSGIIKMCMITASVAGCFALIFFLHCPNVSMAGVTAQYHNYRWAFFKEW